MGKDSCWSVELAVFVASPESTQELDFEKTILTLVVILLPFPHSRAKILGVTRENF